VWQQCRKTVERPPRQAVASRGSRRAAAADGGAAPRVCRRVAAAYGGAQCRHADVWCMRAVQVYHTTDLFVLRYSRRHHNHIVLRYGRRCHLLLVVRQPASPHPPLWLSMNWVTPFAIRKMLVVHSNQIFILDNDNWVFVWIHLTSY
jgi:hypothetical protein